MQRIMGLTPPFPGSVRFHREEMRGRPLYCVEGVATILVKDLGKQILKLKDMGETILFSGQNVRFATLTAERAYVIDKGTIQYQGSIEELSANEEIKRKYLMI